MGGTVAWGSVDFSIRPLTVDDAAAIAGTKIAPSFGAQACSSNHGYALGFVGDADSDGSAGEVWTASTTGAANADMARASDGNTFLAVPSADAILFEAKIVGLADNGEGVGYVVEALLVNNAGTLAIVSSAYTPLVREDSGLTAAAVTLVADDPNNQLEIQVSGVSGRNIKWRAVCSYVRAGGLPA